MIYHNVSSTFDICYQIVNTCLQTHLLIALIFSRIARFWNFVPPWSWLKENPFDVGSANPLYSTSYVAEANRFMKAMEAVVGDSGGGMYVSIPCLELSCSTCNFLHIFCHIPVMNGFADLTLSYVRNRTLTLIEREDDTRSWRNFLVYFSHSTAMPCPPRGWGYILIGC
jgi:hypothetical protein